MRSPIVHGWDTDLSSFYYFGFIAKRAKIVNLKTSFTFDHNGEIEDGQVTLISPAAKQQSTTRLYDKFLKSVHFAGN